MHNKPDSHERKNADSKAKRRKRLSRKKADRYRRFVDEDLRFITIIEPKETK